MTIPQFSWEDVVDQQRYPGQYIIQIAKDAKFRQMVDVDTVPALINYYSTDFQLAYDRTYHWRVAYIDEKEEQNPWSEVRTFELQEALNIITVVPTDG